MKVGVQYSHGSFFHDEGTDFNFGGGVAKFVYWVYCDVGFLVYFCDKKWTLNILTFEYEYCEFYDWGLDFDCGDLLLCLSILEKHFSQPTNHKHLHLQHHLHHLHLLHMPNPLTRPLRAHPQTTFPSLLPLQKTSFSSLTQRTPRIQNRPEDRSRRYELRRHPRAILNR